MWFIVELDNNDYVNNIVWDIITQLFSEFKAVKVLLES